MTEQNGRRYTVSRSILDHYQSVSSMGYRDVLPNQNVRGGFNREDYDFYRPCEATPKDIKKVIKACNDSYKTTLVKNIIDLMGDFAAQGINIVHPDKKSQSTLREWFFNKVNGRDRSERFLNLFYRQGNVFVYRQTAKINRKSRTEMKRAEAEPDITPKKPLKFKKNEIPWRYCFLDPQRLDLVDEELCAFTGNNMYVIKVSDNLKQSIDKALKPNATEAMKALLEEIPEDILALLKANKKEIPVNPDKLRPFFYKKDDWDTWAIPMLYPILPDLKMLEKMKLSDVTALDGAISSIRLWTVGDLEKDIKPTKAGLQRIADILNNNTGGGVMDLIMGPEIKCTVLNSELYKWLGPEKYVTTLNQIYTGLGIPQSLSGGDQKGGFTNNAIAVKTLIERLNYGRDALIKFWQEELRIVQKQLGIKPIAQVQFERMTLSDEAAEKALWIQLVDRKLISVETFQERFGESPMIERLRTLREDKDFKLDKQIEPATTLPTHEQQMEKAALSAGMLTPSQVGIDVPEPKPQEQLLLKKNFKPAGTKPAPKKKGVPGQGRPKGKKDTNKRKKKRVVPIGASANANLFLWATNAFKKISEIIMPAILKKYEKSNARQLTEQQFKEAERLKFAVLCSVTKMGEINNETVGAALLTLSAQNIQSVYNIYESLFKTIQSDATVEDCRSLMIIAYCSFEESKNV